MRRVRLCLRPLALLLALLAGGATAQGPADGPWRLTLQFSSFADGPLGGIERTIELRDGRFEGDFREGQTVVGLRLLLSDSLLRAHMAVKPARGWGSVSVPFEAAVDDGAAERHLSRMAIMLHGGDPDDRETRDLEIQFRLERL